MSCRDHEFDITSLPDKIFPRNVEIKGKLKVKKCIEGIRDLLIEGNATIKKQLTAQLLNILGSAIVNGNLNVSGVLESQLLNILSNAVINGNLNVSGNSNFSGTLQAQLLNILSSINANSITNANTVTSGSTTTGLLDVKNNALIEGDMTVNGLLHNLIQDLLNSCQTPVSDDIYNQWVLSGPITNGNGTVLNVLSVVQDFIINLPFGAFTGSTSSSSPNILNITGVIFGTIQVGNSVTGPNIQAGTVIQSLGSGTGGIGTYILSLPVTGSGSGQFNTSVNSNPNAVFNASTIGTSNQLVVNNMMSGQIQLGNIISGTGVIPGTTITGFVSGFGGIGSYLMSNQMYLQEGTVVTANPVYIPSVLPAPSTLVYGYNSGNALNLSAGLAGTYTNKLTQFNWRYSSPSSGLTFGSPNNLNNQMQKTISWYSSRGFPIPDPDVPPQFNNMFLFSSIASSSLPHISIKPANSLAVISAFVSSNVATLTLDSVPASIGLSTTSPNNSVLVSGFHDADFYFNGTYTITSISGSTITFALTHSNATASVGNLGTVSNQNFTGIPASVDLIASSLPVTGIISLYQPQIASRQLNSEYPVRIQLTTNPSTFESLYNLQPIAYYDVLHHMITVHVPNNSSGYQISQFNSSVPRYTATFQGYVQSGILIVTNMTSGKIAPGQFLSGPGIPNNAQLTLPTDLVNETGSIGTYTTTLNSSTNIGSALNLITITSTNTYLNQAYTNSLVSFDGSFILMTRDSTNQLIPTSLQQAQLLAQCSPTVAFINQSDYGIGSVMQQYPFTFNYSNSTGQYAGVVIPLINRGSSSFDLTCFPGPTTPSTFNQLELTTGLNPTLSPDELGVAAGDNPYTTFVEKVGRAAVVDVFDYNVMPLNFPSFTPSICSADVTVTYPENASSTAGPFPTPASSMFQDFIGHEMQHVAQNLNARWVPIEGISAGVEFDPQLNSSIIYPIRAVQIFDVISALIRGDWIITQSERTPSPNPVTYGSATFWRYIATQIDPNYQVMRRWYELESSDSKDGNYLGYLITSSTTAPTPNNTSGVVANAVPGTAGLSLSLKQALNELYAADIRDVFMNFLIACSMFRNNTSIPLPYRHLFPYWVLWNTSYAGYSQLITNYLNAGGSAFGVAKLALWTYINNNAVLAPALSLVANTIAGNYVGQTFYDNFVRTAGTTSSSNSSGVVSLVIDNSTSKLMVVGISVGDTILVSGFTGPAAAWNGIQIVTGVYDPSNPFSITNNIIQFTGAPNITATNIGIVALRKYTRNLYEMSSLIYQIPPSVIDSTSNVNVTVSTNSPFATSEVRVAICQFTSDGTSVGSFIGPPGTISGPFAATITNSGFVNFNPALMTGISTFSFTGSITSGSNILTVTSVVPGSSIAPYVPLTGINILPGTYIIGQLTGTNGLTGTYTVNQIHPISTGSQNITGSGRSPIRLIIGNVTTTDYSLLPGGQPLDNYYYPVLPSAKITITRS